MHSHSKQDDINFSYGAQGSKKRRRPSFWGCRHRRPSSSAQDRHSGQQTPARLSEPSSSTEAARQRSPPRRARQAHNNPNPTRRPRLAGEHDTMDGGIGRPEDWPSPIGHQDYHSPRPPSSARARAPWPVMQPFRTLAAFVKRCPWAVVSDLGPRGQSAPDEVYYPSVPRSLLHDTAVSFVVKDHTRPDMPEFVISCPFEQVDLIHQLLAPEGSRRQLSARGTSGQPRNGNQLRSMLLDGTPSVELALHPDPGGPGSRGNTFVRNDGGGVVSRPEPGGGRDTGGRDRRESRDDGDYRASPMNEPLGVTEPPVANGPPALPPLHEPDVELPRTREDLPTPVSVASSLLAPITTPWFSPLASRSGHSGGASSCGSPNPFQATVESAPPSPCIEPVFGHDDSAAITLGEGRNSGDNDCVEAHDREQERHGGMTEPPTLVYVPPSPGQVRRGEPVTGWLCEPGWIRRRLRGFTQGNVQGEQQ